MNLDMKFLDNTGAPEEAEPSSWLAREILIIELNSLNQTVKHTGSRQKLSRIRAYLVVSFVFCASAQLPPGSTSGNTGYVNAGGPGGHGLGSSSSGTSPGGSGSMPPLPMRPHAPNAIHHVGISYNLLKGNPDGEYWSTGGEDPGVSLTRRIFTISQGDSPPEVIMEHHDGCQYSHGLTIFYNTKSYQDKLYINVQTSGTADKDLKPYGFTLSSAYQAVAQQTSHHHYVFQDLTNYCKMGHVRYSINFAASDHNPVSSEFALDVCSLPTTYNAPAYMRFIEDWGTHVMTEVTIGKMTTYRYLGHLKDLFNFVVFNVSDEISLGGPTYGYPESYVIDLDSFKYRHEYKHIFGVFEDMLTVGDMYYNDVIGKKLQTIDMALDGRYWHQMQDYITQNICTRDATNHLNTWKANIVQALKSYPTYKRAILPAVEPLAMPVTWPLGSFSLLKPSTGCPNGFAEGSVVLTQEHHTGGPPTGISLAGPQTADRYTLQFCTKEDPSSGQYDIVWPKGDYCIFKYGNCPQGFNESFVEIFTPQVINETGTIPSLSSILPHMFFPYFCCRNDSVYSRKIFLPNSQPFYMFRYKHGCQSVAGMRVQDQTLTLHNPVFPQGIYLPYTETVTGLHGTIQSFIIHLCYYTTLT